MESIEQRLDRLERGHVRWRRASAALVVTMLAMVCLGQRRLDPKVMEAEHLIFRDEAGRVRMELRSAPADGKELPWCGLMFYDDEGKEAGRVRMSGNTPCVQFKGSAKDSLGSAEAVIQADPRIKPEIAVALRAVAEKAGEKLVVVEPGMVSSYGGDGSSTAIGGGLVSVVGGRVQVSESPQARGGAFLGKLQLENPRTGTQVNYPAGTLTILDKDGKLLHQVP